MQFLSSEGVPDLCSVFDIINTEGGGDILFCFTTTLMRMEPQEIFLNISGILKSGHKKIDTPVDGTGAGVFALSLLLADLLPCLDNVLASYDLILLLYLTLDSEVAATMDVTSRGDGGEIVKVKGESCEHSPEC
ncbi:unnamed protein product [Darwinula stevensoni]|uniref:Uncharacterized protein n=1 Tax=Darwinula stevensoni TaxID=69355 RepID=A0A7R9A2D1_9CRUS|nr:unnamed protein product [Darwinula stevensoni]CAG0885394.1 unnamed protein product [Darwinula stevensoni]